MELGERRSRILEAIVNQYVRTAEPVGSETLAANYNFGIKPAMIRHELAAMSELGYLKQPHKSAGRVPSDLGYRYYVDKLMPDPKLGRAEASRARAAYNPYESEIENILLQTCRILSGLAQYTSLATKPQMGTISIRHVALSPIGRGKLLVITVLSTGHIDHRLLDWESDLNTVDLNSIGNLVNERLQGAELREFTTRIRNALPADLFRMTALYKKVVALVKQALVAATDSEVFIDGTSHILKQPEFSRTEKLTMILDALEKRKVLFQVLSTALLGKDVTVIIGEENQFCELSDCSFVTANYHIGDRVCGSIGVVGPTRMDYRRAVAAVELMASSLSQMLTQLSIG
ncbi:MAG: heat-inducible transcriptional repressor HrcA [Armatimonadota bacterium]|nr:heat-inducible transcriptional repressor HrcA [Armatimonadota bacterium]